MKMREKEDDMTTQNSIDDMSRFMKEMYDMLQMIVAMLS